MISFCNANIHTSGWDHLFAMYHTLEKTIGHRGGFRVLSSSATFSDKLKAILADIGHAPHHQMISRWTMGTDISLRKGKIKKGRKRR